MKKLVRMLLIHWHNYEKEVIGFDTINFLTGKTAAGKSTVIDALQLVLLGDTGGSFFNKAANQKSSRTLKSYLFGEKGDDGDTGFRYMRSERFSSYVALEFEDTERKEKFTVGIVCDCYKDQSFDYKWFILYKQGFPENLFVDESTKVPYDINGLKAFLKNRLGSRKKGEFDFYDTNKRYQEVTLAKFGQVKNKYRMLLKKAVPFSPIADIEQFITESVCDVRNQIRIDQMQSDIRQYKNLEEEARRTSEKIEFLKEIHSIHAEYESEKEKFCQQNYVVLRAELEEKEQQEELYKRQVKEKEELIVQHQEEMENIDSKIRQLKEELEKLEQEYFTSDIVQMEKELKGRLAELKEKLNRLEAGVAKAVRQSRGYGQMWTDQLKKLERTGFSAEQTGFIERLEHLKEEEADQFDFMAAAAGFEELKREVDDYRAELKKRADQLKSAVAELEITVAGLKKGIKPYPDEVTTLKRLLEEELFARHKKAVSVSILADLLEIRDQEWRNAIEGYLDKQKFYLLVPEAYYRESLGIYNREKERRKIHDAGLVDIGKLRRDFRRRPAEGTLAEEIETDSADARLYADYLLGGVMKCAAAEDLPGHKTAITKEGMLYKGYVTRNMNPSRYRDPFIGRRSMELLLAQKTEELKHQSILYEQAADFHRIAAAAASREVLGRYEAAQHTAAVEEAGQRNGLRSMIQDVQKEYDSLDFFYLERMSSRIKSLKESIDTESRLQHGLDKKNTVLETELNGLKTEKLPDVMGEITEKKNQIVREFLPAWITETGEPRFQKELAVGRTLPALRTGFYAAMRQTELSRTRLRRERTEKRARYNSEYKMPYDVELESNQHFDKELDNLEGIRLPEYIEKIRDSKEKAYGQFRDDFIAKIKSNIESVSQQIDELNASLKQSVFGTDRYRFEKKPRLEYKGYYDMIMDPMLMDTGGWNVASQSFNEKYQKEIGELFQLLILNETNVSAERRAEYEKSIRKFTDYKTYLVFDLVVTDEQGEEQRLSKTLLKKSGGETQIPFYIALLASFSQVCRIRSKNQNNTIRVIILDEAFSKMDGERIRESIHLLRRFGLQAVFSAPPEKIPDIAPLVDRNIAVYKDSRHSFTRNFDPKEIEAGFLED